MSAPVVSVVTAAYNGAAWLAATLESLAAQTFGDWEAIVVDDCSSDGTRGLVQAWPDPRVRLIALESNGGPVRARNRAVAEARGRYIAGLDQDDLCRSERFSQQVAWLDANPQTVALGTAVEFLTGDAVRPSRYPPITTPGLIDWLLAIENPLVWSSMMIRAHAARRLEPFTRPGLLYAEDFDLYQRLRPLGSIARLDEPLLLYRQHAGGASQRFTATMHGSAEAVLTERHAATLGDGAARAATLLVRHVMGGQPVPNREILRETGVVLGLLQTAYLTEVRPDATTQRLIRWETARRWSGLGRTGLRSGALTLSDVLAVRPPHLGLGYSGVDMLAVAGLVGSGRRIVSARRAASA